MKTQNIFTLFFFSLSIITNSINAKERTIKTIDITTPALIRIELSFPEQDIQINSTDPEIRKTVGHIKAQGFSKLQKRSLSIEITNMKQVLSILPKTEISNIKGALHSLLSALLIEDLGKRSLELSPEYKLTVIHQQDKIIIERYHGLEVEQRFEGNKAPLIESLATFIEGIDELIAEENDDYSVFALNENKHLHSVSQFLNKQSCYLLQQCTQATKKEQIQFYVTFKEDYSAEDLGELLLGLNLDLAYFLYRPRATAELFARYLHINENQQQSQYLLQRLQSYFQRSSDDPYKLLEMSHFISTAHTYNEKIKQKLSEINQELRLKPVFTTDEKDEAERLKRTELLLQKLINTNDWYLPYSTRFEVDVLRTEDPNPIDHRKIDYQLFYKLFKRAIQEFYDENAVYYGSVYAQFVMVFLYENYEQVFIQSVIQDMHDDTQFKKSIDLIFAEFWQLYGDLYNEHLWSFMIQVEQGYLHSEPKSLQENIEKRFKELRDKRRDKTVRENYSLLQWWKKAYQEQSRSEEEFYEGITNLITETEEAEAISEYVADIFTKLIIFEIQKQNYAAGKKLVEFYIHKSVPVVGISNKSTDIVSSALVLNIITKDEELRELAFDKLLGKDFDIKAIDNEVLLFNLACYYAINKQKTQMLISIKQALKHGKTAEQFLNDNDFRLYHNDEEFLQTLKSQVSTVN